MEDWEWKIPLKNKQSEIIDYAFVSEEDYELTSNHNWHIAIRRKDTKYEKKYVKGPKDISMQEFILGKSDINGEIIHHKNGNSLDNRRNNLIHTTIKINNQARICKLGENSTYRGVRQKCQTTWVAECGSEYIGSFKTDREAAIAYDKFAFVSFGPLAYTNKLVTYEEVKDLKIEDIVTKKIKELPKNILKSDEKFYAAIKYNKKEYKYLCNTLEEAQEKLIEFKAIIQVIKDKEKEEHFNKEITRDHHGRAAIYIKNKKKQIIGKAIVNDDKWHMLSQISWNFDADKYVKGSPEGIKTTMHNYLKNEKLVDHANNVNYDNRLENLRSCTYGQNNHNRKKQKNTASKYIGVRINDKNKYDKWFVTIRKDKKTYWRGSFHTEIQAALAYNKLATELYGSFARLNIINEEDIVDILSDTEYEYSDTEDEPVCESTPEPTLESEILESTPEPEIPESTPESEASTSVVKKYHGIHYEKNKWRAKITHNQKSHRLGTFATQEEAALAYNNKAIELLGDKAKLNIII